MHSRIFGIVETKKTNENYEENKQDILQLDEYEVYESMRNVADYVSSDTNLLEDINWLKEFLPNIFNFTSDTTFTLNYEALQQYFDNKLLELKNFINGIETTDDYFNKKYGIKKLTDNEFSFWVIEDMCSYSTLDGFLRFELKFRKIDNKEFEIVKTFDYHW